MSGQPAALVVDFRARLMISKADGVVDVLKVLGAGFVGASSSTLAALAPWQDQVQWWLQIACAVLGLFVTILTIIYIRLKLKILRKTESEPEEAND